MKLREFAPKPGIYDMVDVTASCGVESDENPLFATISVALLCNLFS
jgi:hypothetical protein